MKFPVISFSKPHVLYVYRNKDELSTCSNSALSNGYFNNLYIIDSGGISYKVLSAKKIGVVGPFGGFNIFLNKKIRVELELEILSNEESLDEIKKKIFEAFIKDKDLWESSGNLHELKSKISIAKSVAEIIECIEHEQYKQY